MIGVHFSMAPSLSFHVGSCARNVLTLILAAFNKGVRRQGYNRLSVQGTRQCVWDHWNLVLPFTQVEAEYSISDQESNVYDHKPSNEHIKGFMVGEKGLTTQYTTHANKDQRHWLNVAATGNNGRQSVTAHCSDIKGSYLYTIDWHAVPFYLILNGNDQSTMTLRNGCNCISCISCLYFKTKLNINSHIK